MNGTSESHSAGGNTVWSWLGVYVPFPEYLSHRGESVEESFEIQTRLMGHS